MSICVREAVACGRALPRVVAAGRGGGGVRGAVRSRAGAIQSVERRSLLGFSVVLFVTFGADGDGDVRLLWVHVGIDLGRAHHLIACVASEAILHAMRGAEGKKATDLMVSLARHEIGRASCRERVCQYV